MLGILKLGFEEMHCWMSAIKFLNNLIKHAKGCSQSFTNIMISLTADTWSGGEGCLHIFSWQWYDDMLYSDNSITTQSLDPGTHRGLNLFVQKKPFRRLMNNLCHRQQQFQYS